MQCSYLYTQLISLLTGGINKELKKRPNRDIFHLVAGTEKYFDALIPAMDSEPEFLLNAVQCLPLDAKLRASVGRILSGRSTPELFYAVLIARGRLINVVRPKVCSAVCVHSIALLFFSCSTLKEHALYPADLHLIFNFVRASSAGLRSSESWTPLCLPNFNDSGYLHAHISFMDGQDVCLLLITTVGTQPAFYALQECAGYIRHELISTRSLEAIQESLREGHYVLPSINIPCLLHFLYKSNSTSQVAMASSPEVFYLFALFTFFASPVHVAGIHGTL